MAATHDKTTASSLATGAGAGTSMGHAQCATGSFGAAGTGAGGMNTGAAPDKGAGFVDTVKETAQNVAHTVTDFAHQAKDKAQHFAAGAGDTMGHARENVMQFGSTAYGRTGDAMTYAGDEMTTLIRRYPVPALLVGFGVGFLLAQLTTDRD